MTASPAGGTQSIRRALNILRELAVGRAAGVRLTDVTRNTGMNHATAHRMLRVLIDEGIVEQNPTTKRYMIGEQIPLLALARPAVSALQQIAEGWLRRAGQEIGDTAFLTVRTGLDTLCVARHLGIFPVQVLMIEVGARRPLGVSCAGIAMLAAMSEAQSHDVLVRNTDRLAAYRMTAERALHLVGETRERGYAVRQRGLVTGTKAISLCIRRGNGVPVAALTIAGVDRRLTALRILEIAFYLQRAVMDIEHSLTDRPE